MKRKTKRIISLVVMICLFAACSITTPVPTSIKPSETPIIVKLTIATLVTPIISSTQGPPSTLTAEEEFAKTLGIKITALSLCSDGAQTAVHLRIDLDTKAWRLEQKDFLPQGKTYLQTVVSLYANGKKYANESGGSSEDPIFIDQTGTVIIKQTSVFPIEAGFGPTYSIKAHVLMVEVPQMYTPVAPLKFVGPGFIDVPMEYEIPVTLEMCP